ncbi:SDR family oxidoreductase [Nocardioides turkmenicus]|uniref:SDR family oxidoreductase n=1 Tax=Nocardioides turkmenicus TaxID=2711220 RepID=UPI003B96F747
MDITTADGQRALVDAATSRFGPVGRFGTPEEFAAAVTFLASIQASHITGEQIRCDGGLVRSTDPCGSVTKSETRLRQRSTDEEPEQMDRERRGSGAQGNHPAKGRV